MFIECSGKWLRKCRENVNERNWMKEEKSKRRKRMRIYNQLTEEKVRKTDIK